MKRTKKAEANHKREEFLKAALLYCHLHANPDTAYQKVWYVAEQEMHRRYKELGES